MPAHAITDVCIVWARKLINQDKLT